MVACNKSTYIRLMHYVYGTAAALRSICSTGFARRKVEFIATSMAKSQCFKNLFNSMPGPRVAATQSTYLFAYYE